MILCHLTTCYSTESAWFQRLKLKCGKPLSNLAFEFNSRHYIMVVDILPVESHKDPFQIKSPVTKLPVWWPLGKKAFEAGAFTRPHLTST